MATIIREFLVNAPVSAVWDALRDFDAVDRRVAPGFITNCRTEAGARILTFANGVTVREVLVGIDDDARRIAYTVSDGFAKHHNASAQVFEGPGNSTRFVWITDVLPDSVAEQMRPMMDQGVVAMKQALSTGAAAKRSAGDFPRA